jgi:DAACS family dicarboxylate/amino acid:cation (Na+ or H+) symporter
VKLQTQILLALVAGVLLAGGARWLGLEAVGAFFLAAEPVGTIFIRLISMVVIPLVIASVFVGVASLGETRALGRMGGWTLGYFLSTTLCAAVIGVTVAGMAGVGAGRALPQPSRVEFTLQSKSAGLPVGPASSTPRWVQSIVDLVPPNPFKAAADGDLLPLIIAVCIFGAAAAVASRTSRQPLVALLSGVNDIAMVVIGWIMRGAPLAVFVLIGATIARSGVDLLWSLLAFVLVVVLALALHVGLVLMPILTIGARMGPGLFFRSVSEALVLAFSTASSTATLPVSMANAARLGVPAAVVDFVLPIGSTVNKNGAAVYKAVTAVFLANIYGFHLGPAGLVSIILASTVAAFTGAGVPGSSLVTTMIVLNAIGLGADAAAGIALVTGVDRPLDMCRTTVNTMSNLVGAVFVARRQA